ncbi:hypothetical protein DSAG12_00299 [Promethearchaeum syntrophicum]|uniref:Uncharacterized protein n=1 Tax=Promethearchaeum syntrophicum TaxID=2594042 RepID=A0A5B9D675_9ARCH|nr:hypothetical protein [Candidatus Prometheoarchaeum syntrophicum]QEE14486.1 hypothetical protein DSAG12_00299 [Candidatus Prometheoarchaeum syntrophicum]
MNNNNELITDSKFEIQALICLITTESNRDLINAYFLSERKIPEDVNSFFAKYGFKNFEDLRFGIEKIFEKDDDWDKNKIRLFIYVRFSQENVPSKYLNGDKNLNKELGQEYGSYILKLMVYGDRDEDYLPITEDRSLHLYERVEHIYSGSGADFEAIEVYFEEKFNNMKGFKNWVVDTFPNSFFELKTQKNGDDFYIGFLSEFEALELLDTLRKRKTKARAYSVEDGEQISDRDLLDKVGNAEHSTVVYGY